MPRVDPVSRFADAPHAFGPLLLAGLFVLACVLILLERDPLPRA